MKALLQQYLLEHQHLALPGIGVLRTAMQPASYHVADRSFLPPICAFEFEAATDGASTPIQPLAGYLAVQKKISEEDAFEAVQQYLNGAAVQLEQTGRLAFAPIGSFEKTTEGAIVFKAETITSGLADIEADRVIREGVAHQMVVGDTDTTTVEMEAFLSENEEATDRWWLLPLLLALGAITLIIWHYASLG